MRSEKQIEASRKNGAMSRGPVSSKGREKSSRNNTRHGLLSKTIVLRDESKTRFDSLLSALHEALQPQSIVESNLVDTMAVARWRLMRLWSMESASITYEISKQSLNPASPDVPTDPATRAALAFRELTDNSRSLDAFNRYESRFDRQYNRALDRLTRIREKTNSAIRTQDF